MRPRGRPPGIPQKTRAHTNREHELYHAIGEAIKRHREHRELTQEELAGTVGLTRTSITNIEAGRQHTLLHVLDAIASALGITVQDLWPIPAKVTADGPWYAGSHSWDVLD